MSTETNKTIARRLVRAINQQNLAEIDAVFAPELAQEWKSVTLPWLYSTFAEHHVEITEMLAEDDRVVFWGDTSGLHSSEVDRLPPTGRTFELHFCDVYQIRNRKITRHASYYDALSFMQQLGVIPQA